MIYELVNFLLIKIRFKTSKLRSDLCNYIDAYIVVKGIINITGTNANNRRNIKLPFKNNAPFRSCISKINNTFIDSSKDLDIFIPIIIMKIIL